MSTKRQALERDIERELVARAKACGGEVRKVRWIGRMHAPDRVVMLPPPDGSAPGTWVAPIWVELKAPGKPLRPGQAREHARMRRAGQRVVKVDSIQGVAELLP